MRLLAYRKQSGGKVTAPTAKDRAWVIFDRIIEDAAPGGAYSNPWYTVNGSLDYVPDLRTLERLLGVPLYLGATVRSGVSALALDVWLAYELRRAGFDRDAVWPRDRHPRILPGPVERLVQAVPVKEREKLRERLERKAAIPGVTSSSASILGKNYLKQVDVIMTDWATGPEVLISTKRMDSSYAKNAPNRVEESYGDAKNLRLRHPMAALGFLMGVRSNILGKERATFDWLNDLVAKLGEEDDAYHATCLLVLDYGPDVVADEDDQEEPEGMVTDAGADPSSDVEEEVAVIPLEEIDQALALLPPVRILGSDVDPRLSPGAFLSAIVHRVLDVTPITMHVKARAKRRSPGTPAE